MARSSPRHRATRRHARPLAITVVTAATLGWAGRTEAATDPVAASTHVFADASTPDDRPYGSVMGDGLRAYHRDQLISPDGGPVTIEVCADGETLMGIDVSYYQGTIDWNAVAADGVSFAWVRVSHSTQFFDPEFETNWANARAAGIHTGVYQYFEPTEDPIAQADLMLEAMGTLQPGDMPPMIDVESPDPVAPVAYADAIRAWLDHVEAATGVPPFIYTGYYYWNDNVGTDEFIDHPLWIANYNPGCPLIPDYWVTWAVHQYCACETIAGISGPVDGDTFNGSLDDLMALSVGGGVCGDGICAGESPYTCPDDCPPCGVIGPDGGSIDNGDACYELYGNDAYWREELDGFGGSLVWTHATDFDAPDNYAVWRMFFEEDGLYSVEVHIPQPWGQSQQAVYRIASASGEQPVTVNQSTEDGWVWLADLQFLAATDHWVRLDDDTGEPLALERQIVYDALRVTRLDGGSGDTTTGGGSGPSGNDTSGGGDTTSGDLPGGTGGGTGASGPALPGAGDGGDEGCGCRSDHGGRLGWGLMGLLLIATRRRRAGPRA